MPPIYNRPIEILSIQMKTRWNPLLVNFEPKDFLFVLWGLSILFHEWIIGFPYFAQYEDIVGFYWGTVFGLSFMQIGVIWNRYREDWWRFEYNNLERSERIGRWHFRRWRLLIYYLFVKIVVGLFVGLYISAAMLAPWLLGIYLWRGGWHEGWFVWIKALLVGIGAMLGLIFSVFFTNIKLVEKISDWRRNKIDEFEEFRGLLIKKID